MRPLGVFPKNNPLQSRAESSIPPGSRAARPRLAAGCDAQSLPSNSCVDTRRIGARDCRSSSLNCRRCASMARNREVPRLLVSPAEEGSARGHRRWTGTRVPWLSSATSTYRIASAQPRVAAPRQLWRPASHQPARAQGHSILHPKQSFAVWSVAADQPDLASYSFGDVFGELAVPHLVRAHSGHPPWVVR
jgi:hypothetical protein